MSIQEDLLSKRAISFLHGKGELEHTLRSIEELKGVSWAGDLVSKTELALSLSDWLSEHENRKGEPDWLKKWNEIQALDSAFLQIRFAYDLHKAGVESKYESKSAGGPSVTFQFSLDSATFFVDLLVARQSEAADGQTLEHNDAEKFQRIQQEIVKKYAHRAQRSDCDADSYNVVIADTRGISGGEHLRQEERTQLVWGAKYFLAHRGAPEQAVWVEAKDATGNLSKSLFVGLFDEGKSGDETELLRSRVHLLGLVSEKSFGQGEVLKQIRLYQNPFIDNSEDALDAFYIASAQS